jgi:hypothetical protein
MEIMMMQTQSKEEEKGVSEPDPDSDPGPRRCTRHNHNPPSKTNKSLLKPCTQNKWRTDSQENR